MDNLNLPFRSYEGKNPYIFVSYAHGDSQRVFPIIARLNRDGYRLWYDEGIDPGTEWPEEIAAHLEGCHTFLLFISPRSIQSQNVRREINLAISRKKHLICVYLEETQLSAGMEMQLSLLQSIHCTYPHTEDFFQRLERVLGPVADATPPGGFAARPVAPQAAPAAPGKPRRPLIIGLGAAAAVVVVAIVLVVVLRTPPVENVSSVPARGPASSEGGAADGDIPDYFSDTEAFVAELQGDAAWMINDQDDDPLVRTLVAANDMERSREVLLPQLEGEDLTAAVYHYYLYLPDLSQAPPPAVGPNAPQGEREAALREAIAAAPKTVEYMMHGDVEDYTLMWYDDPLHETVAGIRGQLEEFFARAE